ncbi:pseudouridine synthase [Spirosoma sp.]|uniref:pseudouridine synthase n=1 Tax=Spirosoma sp. TaxID=1899569 RepID=UPI003B3B5E0A
MNQDSEQNDSRRDGEPLRRTGRSFDRRDDGRNSETPRFNRSRNDDSAGRGEQRNVPNRFRRDEDSGAGNRDSRPPRFNREGGFRNNERSNDERRPRFERDDRPDFKRDNRSGNDRPRFNSDRRDNRQDDSRPRFDRSDRSETPSYRRDDRFGRNEESSRFNRNNDRFDRNVDRFGNEPNQRSERFPKRNDSERPRFDRDRSEERSNREDRPRFNADRPRTNDQYNRGENRSERTGRNDRFADNNFRRDRDERSERPSRFSGERSDRGDKPAFKRVGGFNREADERNKNRFDNNDEPRSGGRREFRSKTSRDESWSGESKFSGQQRKDSSDRRTGKYTKSPNYNLEDARSYDSVKKSAPKGKRSDYEGDSDKPKRTASSDGLTRLNRYIANSGVCSRREADELIARGDISVNGKVVTEMGYKVKEGDRVKYGTKVLNPERFVYVLLNKPKDYITTTEDPEERKTVMELVADAGNFRMYPVGRLDRNTTGLLLLTNDGELADKLTHPSNNIRKIYQVEIDKPITDEHFEAIKKGIELEDGPIKPDALSIVTPDAQVIGIEIHSGRNRIVRRIFEHFGYEVTKLDRTTYAGLTKKELPRGKWRFLDPKEVVKLKYFN